MRKKLFTVLMCAVLTMSLTAGCGNSGGTEGDGQPEQSQEQETEKEEETPLEEEQKADAFSEEQTEPETEMPGSVILSKTEGVADTAYGKVRGFIDEGTYTFRGVPYAKAERFQMPEAPDAWDDVLNCVVYGPTAPITKMTSPDGGDYLIPHRYWAQNENCQNLNIWTQSLDPGAKKPVMVWFHGGGFTNGSAIEGVAYDGKNLSEYGDVVVVTVNHRLNVLGYLDLSEYGEEYKYSGNAGTADLVASLKWVQENIANFGGDPENVTIFGQSGGGRKVLSMMMTPEAEGLFDRAVVQSTNTSYQSQEAAQLVAAYTLENLGLTEAQVAKLKEVPYDTLDEAASQAQKRVNEELGTGGSWMPVIDGDYLPAAPLDGGLQEWTKDVPLMIGSVFGETNSFAEVDPNAVNKNDWTDEEVSEKLTEKFGENAEAVLEAFRRAWPEKKDANACYVDDSKRRAAFEVVEKRNESGAENNYIFLLSYESPVDGGVSMWHCGEIPFIFHNLDLTGVGASYGNTAEAYRLQDEMCSAWVNFARNGDPNGENVPQWSTYTAEKEATMVFDTQSGERVAFDKELQDLMK